MTTENETKMVKRAGVEFELPDFVPVGKATGAEHIRKEDIQLPRLALAQKTNPEVDPSEAAHLEGLKVGDFFRNVEPRTIYPQPVEFIILRGDQPRWIEFIPRELGGGVKDMNVKPGDPRTLFTMKDGQSVPPAATMFYDFVIMLLPSREIIGLSFKSTGIPVARQLNLQMAMRPIPIYAVRYQMTSKDKKNKKGSFKIQNILPVGALKDRDVYDLAAGMYENLKTKTIDIVDRQGDHAPVDDNPITPGEPGVEREPGEDENM